MKWVKTQTHFKRPIYVAMEDQYVSWCILHRGIWEEHIDWYISNNLKPDDVFLDLGANLGYFSLLAAHRFEVTGGSGFVIAVEANPEVVLHLMGSVVESCLGHRIKILPYAAADKTGLVYMREHTDGNLGSVSLKSPDSPSVPGGSVVPSVRLDDMLGDLNRLDLIKMDIEGAEVLALDGMTQIFSKFSPDMIVEINREHLQRISNISVTDFVIKMESLGYTAHAFYDGVRTVEYDEINRMIDHYHGHCDFLFKRLRRAT